MSLSRESYQEYLDQVMGEDDSDILNLNDSQRPISTDAKPSYRPGTPPEDIFETPHPLTRKPSQDDDDGASLPKAAPLSPFSPLLTTSRKRRKQKNESASLPRDVQSELSLQSTRKVSIVIHVNKPIKGEDEDTKICLFPLVAPHERKQNGDDTEDELSPARATLEAAENTRDIVVVNPKAFGKLIPSKVTMETARLVAQMSNISSEDWARSYHFQQVIWPGSTDALQNLSRAIVNDVTTPGSISSRTVLALGHPEKNRTIFGSVGQKSVAQVFAESASFLDASDILERYGLLGLTAANIFTRLPEHTVCTLSLLEIADEDSLFDLLATRPFQSEPNKGLRIRYSGERHGAVVQGLSDVPLDSLKGLGHCLRRGFAAALHKKRKQQRGHILATLKVWQNATKQGMKAKCTVAQFVDLAIVEHDGAAANAKRDASIRKGIWALGGVLRGTLLREAGNDASISYRESTLTKILQRSVDHPDSRIIVMAAVSPHRGDYEATLATLRYVSRLLYRSGQTLQSPFETPSKTTSPTSQTSTDAQSQITFEQFDGQEELLQNMLSDPRQRLAKVMKPQRANLALNRDEVGAEAYIPTKYMDKDPAKIGEKRRELYTKDRAPQHSSDLLPDEAALPTPLAKNGRARLRKFRIGQHDEAHQEHLGPGAFASPLLESVDRDGSVETSFSLEAMERGDEVYFEEPSPLTADTGEPHLTTFAFDTAYSLDEVPSHVVDSRRGRGSHAAESSKHDDVQYFDHPEIGEKIDEIRTDRGNGVNSRAELSESNIFARNPEESYQLEPQISWEPKPQQMDDLSLELRRKTRKASELESNSTELQPVETNLPEVDLKLKPEMSNRESPDTQDMDELSYELFHRNARKSAPTSSAADAFRKVEQQTESNAMYLHYDTGAEPAMQPYTSESLNRQAYDYDGEPPLRTPMHRASASCPASNQNTEFAGEMSNNMGMTAQSPSTIEIDRPKESVFPTNSRTLAEENNAYDQRPKVMPMRNETSRKEAPALRQLSPPDFTSRDVQEDVIGKTGLIQMGTNDRSSRGHVDNTIQVDESPTDAHGQAPQEDGEERFLRSDPLLTDARNQTPQNYQEEDIPAVSDQVQMDIHYRRPLQEGTDIIIEAYRPPTDAQRDMIAESVQVQMDAHDRSPLEDTGTFVQVYRAASDAGVRPPQNGQVGSTTDAVPLQREVLGGTLVQDRDTGARAGLFPTDDPGQPTQEEGREQSSEALLLKKKNAPDPSPHAGRGNSIAERTSHKDEGDTISQKDILQTDAADLPSQGYQEDIVVEADVRSSDALDQSPANLHPAMREVNAAVHRVDPGEHEDGSTTDISVHGTISHAAAKPPKALERSEGNSEAEDPSVRAELGGLEIQKDLRGISDRSASEEIDALEAVLGRVKQSSNNVWESSLSSIDNLRYFHHSQQEIIRRLTADRDEAKEELKKTRDALERQAQLHQRQAGEQHEQIEALQKRIEKVQTDRSEVVKIAEEAIGTQAELEQKVTDLEAELSALSARSIPKDEMSALEESNVFLSKELKELRAEAFQYKSQLNDQNIVVSELQFTVQSLEKERAQLNDRKEGDERRIEMLRNDLALAKNAREELKSLRVEVSRLSREKDAADAAWLRRESELTSQLNERDTQEQWYKTTSEQLQRELESLKAEQRRETDNSSREIEQLQNQVSGLKQELASVRGRSEDVERRLAAEIRSKESVSGELGRTRDDLERRISDVKELSANLKSVLSEKEEDEAKISRMERALQNFQDETRSRVEKVVKHRNEAASLLQETLIENQKLAEKNEELQVALEELQRDRDETQRLGGYHQARRDARPAYAESFLQSNYQRYDPLQDRHVGYHQARESRPHPAGMNGRDTAIDADEYTGLSVAVPQMHRGETDLQARTEEVAAYMALVAKASAERSSTGTLELKQQLYALEDAKDAEIDALKARIRGLERRLDLTGDHGRRDRPSYGRSGD